MAERHVPIVVVVVVMVVARCLACKIDKGSFSRWGVNLDEDRKDRQAERRGEALRRRWQREVGATNERSRQAAGSKKAELEKRIEAKFKLDLTDSGFADFWDVLR